MPAYIHQLPDWPHFIWQHDQFAVLLAEARHRQRRLLGKMESQGSNLQSEANLQTCTLDVLKSGEIKWELLDGEQVRSFIARRLGMDIAGLVPTDRYVEGIVKMLLDATQQCQQPLSEDQLFGWHSAMV